MPKKIIKKDKKIKTVTVKKIKTAKKIDKVKKAKKSKNLIRNKISNRVKYFEAKGRRKTATARVRLFARNKTFKGEIFLINEKPLDKYFPTLESQEIIFSPFREVNCLDRFRFSIKVKGGGVSSQVGAVRHGIAKALMFFNPDFRKKLKKAGFLTRDPRMRERKKFGLKRARRAPQWSKR